MATRVPRVGVTLSDEDRDLVQRLAALQETSASKIIASIVADFRPVLRQVVELGEASKNLTEEQRARVAALAENLEPQLMGDASAAISSWNDAVTKMKGALS